MKGGSRMGQDKKVVYKAFDYTSCDHFARYLEEMAAKGWHFKQWSTGLVFEKGEPEQAVYAVEVFIDGSEYDVRPGVHTLNFADYCEAAGWKLVDGKRKFCIFKQMRPDAEPILTPQERVNNAAKAAGRGLWSSFALSMLWLGMFVINFTVQTNFISTVFSNTMLLSMSVFVLLFLLNSIRILCLFIWKHRAQKLAKSGAYRVLTARGQGIDIYITVFIGFMFAAMMLLQGEFMHLLWFMIVILVAVGAAWLIAKIRPDPETNNLIQIGAAVVLFLTFAVMAVVMIATDHDRHDQQVSKECPLYYEDIGIDAGQVSSEFVDVRTSILGTHLRCSTYYGTEYPKASLGYAVYRTDCQWILDKIWNHQLEAANNADRADCTDAWDAVIAYSNNQYQYYVRYDNAILILSADERILTQEQIDTVIDLLELG